MTSRNIWHPGLFQSEQEYFVPSGTTFELFEWELASTTILDRFSTSGSAFRCDMPSVMKRKQKSRIWTSTTTAFQSVKLEKNCRLVRTDKEFMICMRTYLHKKDNSYRASSPGSNNELLGTWWGHTFHIPGDRNISDIHPTTTALHPTDDLRLRCIDDLQPGPQVSDRCDCRLQ